MKYNIVNISSIQVVEVLLLISRDGIEDYAQDIHNYTNETWKGFVALLENVFSNKMKELNMHFPYSLLYISFTFFTLRRERLVRPSHPAKYEFLVSHDIIVMEH